MSISKKRLINQLELFLKPCFVIMNGGNQTIVDHIYFLGGTNQNNILGDNRNFLGQQFIFFGHPIWREKLND
jgi:hypothetical protein